MRRHSGFTLIELIVSISIIAIILSFTFAGINSSRRKSRDAKRIADLRTLQAALEQHALGDKTRSYPPDESTTGAELDAYCNNASLPPAAKNKGLYDNSCFKSYLSVVPRDPQTNAKYQYVKSACFRIFNDGRIVIWKQNVNQCAGLQGTYASYGLRVNLEADNSEAQNDLTPAYARSFDIGP